MPSSTSSSTQRGKRRIHHKPDAGEIEACRWWIEHERTLIRPPVTVALGATAARSLLEKTVTIGRVRGAPLKLADGGECWVTVHPSFLLRMPEQDRQARGAGTVRARLEADQGKGLAGRGVLRERKLARARIDTRPCHLPPIRGRAGRDIIVAVGGREIMRAEQILDVDLGLDPPRQFEYKRARRPGRSRAASPHC